MRMARAVLTVLLVLSGTTVLGIWFGIDVLPWMERAVANWG